MADSKCRAMIEPNPKLLGACDRIDARRLLERDPYARQFHDMIAHAYLGSQLTVAEIRALVTLGLEYGMSLETRPMRVTLAAALSEGGTDGK